MNPYEDINWMPDEIKETNRKEAKHIVEARRVIRAIRKEIALDIQSGTPIDEARQKANIKYGKGWRERGLVTK